MPKSIHRPEYAALLELVREARRSACITQVDLSNRLGRPQSFVSDIERGSRRLDLVELRDVCHLLGCDLPGFVASFEDALKHQRQSKAAIPRKRATKPVR